MRILFLHNYYRFRGGEDLSFEADVQLLRNNDHEVLTITRHNGELSDGLQHSLSNAQRTIWNGSAQREIHDAIHSFRPHVMHCNNLFPQFSSSVYSPASKAGVAIVQAIRNYRWFCANSFLFREGKVCTDCIGSLCATSGVKHGCYRDSRKASAVLAVMQLSQRIAQRWSDPVDAFFTPSEFARELHIQGGFNPNRIHVKTNFIDPDPGPGLGDGNYAVFVGRLSEEKGIHELVRAWSQLPRPIRLLVIGDGPLRHSLTEHASNSPVIEFLGDRSHHQVLELLGKARFLVMPSVWYETFGRTIIEAFSRGTPVVASRLGAMKELVVDGHNGVLIEPSNVPDLTAGIERILGLDTNQTRKMRDNARTSYLRCGTASNSYQQLSKIYSSAIRHSSERRRRRKESA